MNRKVHVPFNSSQVCFSYVSSLHSHSYTYMHSQKHICCNTNVKSRASHLYFSIFNSHRCIWRKREYIDFKPNSENGSFFLPSIYSMCLSLYEKNAFFTFLMPSSFGEGYLFVIFIYYLYNILSVFLRCIHSTFWKKLCILFIWRITWWRFSSHKGLYLTNAILFSNK